MCIGIVKCKPDPVLSSHFFLGGLVKPHSIVLLYHQFLYICPSTRPPGTNPPNLILTLTLTVICSLQ